MLQLRLRSGFERVAVLVVLCLLSLPVDFATMYYFGFILISTFCHCVVNCRGGAYVEKAKSKYCCVSSQPL